MYILHLALKIATVWPASIRVEFRARSVRPFLTTTYYGKTADSIEMASGVTGRVGTRNDALVNERAFWGMEMG